MTLAAGASAMAQFDLPIELRNDVASLTIADERSAGAVALIDERWKRRRVAIASGASADIAQPLLAPTYYLSRALTPFADIREWRDSASDPIVSLIAEKPAVLALADMSVGSGAAHDALVKFVEDGGVLVRFAGARLAATADDLTPTALRHGGRTLGGALSWETPKRLAPFDRDSPFFGLAVPEEVTILRQVLAEPEPGLAAKTWARLADGTPLVTAERRGKGLIVLFHVTADTTWSNLPLSGLFVDMLRKIVALAGAPAPDKRYRAIARRGEPRQSRPGAHARRLWRAGRAARHRQADPGRFRRDRRRLPSARLLRFRRRADRRQCARADPGIERADYGSLHVQAGALNVAAPIDLRKYLLGAAFIGLLADALASLWLGGAFGLRRASTIAATIAILSLCAIPLGMPLPQRAFAAEQAPISDRDRDAALVDPSRLCRHRRCRR